MAAGVGSLMLLGVAVTLADSDLTHGAPKKVIYTLPSPIGADGASAQGRRGAISGALPEPVVVPWEDARPEQEVGGAINVDHRGTGVDRQRGGGEHHRTGESDGEAEVSTLESVLDGGKFVVQGVPSRIDGKPRQPEARATGGGRLVSSEPNREDAALQQGRFVSPDESGRSIGQESAGRAMNVRGVERVEGGAEHDARLHDRTPDVSSERVPAVDGKVDTPLRPTVPPAEALAAQRVLAVSDKRDGGVPDSRAALLRSWPPAGEAKSAKGEASVLAPVPASASVSRAALLGGGSWGDQRGVAERGQASTAIGRTEKDWTASGDAPPRGMPGARTALVGDGLDALRAELCAHPAASGLFVVQVGAFAEPERALRAREELKRLGYDGYVEAAGALERVRLGPFSRREDAEHIALKLMAAGQNALVGFE